MTMLIPRRAIVLLANLLCLPVLLVASSPATPSPNPGAAAVAPASPASAADEKKAASAPKPDPAAEKFWLALKLLRSPKPADLAAGRTALQAASDLEFTHAQTLLANCLVAGSYGFAKDANKGANLFRLAAEHGNAFAKVSLGQCLFTGTGVRKDLAKATEWLTAALEPGADFSRPTPPPDFFAADPAKSGSDAGGVAGDVEHDPVSESQAAAHFFLGQICDLQKKTSEAQAHFVAAASAGPGGRDGLYLAAVQAALNFAFGNGTTRDLAKAHEMLDQSRKLAGRMGVSLIHNYVSLKIVDEFATADLEDSMTQASAANETELQFKIASTFADKKSKEYNIIEAVKWYELAADSGQAWAMLSLAFIYSHGDLGQPDPQKAFQWFERAGGGEKPKHFLATANLGICFLNGLGTAADPERAMAIFRKHQAYEIVCYLGSIGHCPRENVTFEETVKLNQEWARERNDPHAQYLLALRYQNGWGVKSDRKEALKLLKQAADKNDGYALCDLGLLYETQSSIFGINNNNEAQRLAVKYYRTASEAGNVEATANYANMLASGNGIVRDVAKAEALYLKCLVADPNNARAHNNLALIYSDRLLGVINQGNAAPHALLLLPQYSPATVEWRGKMLRHFEAAAAQEYPYALSNLGDLYYTGKLVPRDLRKAMGYFEQLTGSPAQRANAHFMLGQMHERGEGVPVTFTEAAYHYRLAALDGNAEALRRLVGFYVAGKGVSRDLDRAIYWMSILAKNGYPASVQRLGDLYIQNQDYSKALTLFSNLANHQLPEVRGSANQRLSILYAHGWGVTKDPKKARKYREKALKDNNLPALHDTAMALFADGNKGEAIKSLETAAARGLPDSKYELGRLCLNGDGVAKDVPRGLKLFNEAAAEGSQNAQVALATLTLDNIPGAPDLETAIQFAGAAAASGQDAAAELREKLEQRRKAANAAPEEDTRPRSS